MQWQSPMAAYAAAAIDLVHVLAMIAWIAGLPILLTSRWPRLKRTYAIYAVTFVVLTQVSRLVLGECFLTTLVRPLYERAGATISPDWFTVRLSRAVFGLAPSRRAITVVSQVLVAITAAGALLSLRRQSRRTEVPHAPH